MGETRVSKELTDKMRAKLAAGFAAGDQAELLEAARQDAKEAEAYAAELEAKLEKAVETLEKLARLGNGDRYGNSDGNMIARATLAILKGETDE